MGGSEFTNRAQGSSAEEAFRALCADAAYEKGHGGYTGTVAEKHDFTVRRPGEGVLKELADKAKVRLTEKRAAVQAAPIDSVKCYAMDSDHSANEDQRAARLKKLDAALTPEGLREAALREWMSVDLNENDKWGPAFCLVLREASAVKPLTKTAAEKLAKEKYGPTATVVLKRAGGKATAYVEKTVPGNRPGPEFGSSGMYTTGVNGCTYSFRHTTGDSADEARGKLFAEPGLYLFYGIASS